MRPQAEHSNQLKRRLDQTSNAVLSKQHAESEVEQDLELALPYDSSDTDAVQEAENIMKTATREAISLMRYQVEKKAEFVIVDNKLQELYREDGAARMRCLEIQMEDEALGQEKDSHLKSCSGLAARIKNAQSICTILKQHLEKLQLTAGQMTKVRNELCITYSALSDDLQSRLKNHKIQIMEYKNNIERLKRTVVEEHQSRISESDEANRNYQRQAEILNEKMLEMKQVEERYPALKLEKEELELSTTEEQLKLKEELKCAHDSLQSLDRASQTLVTNIHCYKSKKQELEKLLHGLTVEREFLKKKVIDLEEWFETVSCEEKLLSEELNSAKQKLFDCQSERAAKCVQEHAVEADIADLVQQKLEFENKFKDVNRKLEDDRTKLEGLMQDVINLGTTLEKIRSENEVISHSYRSELSDLETELNIVKEEVEAKDSKLKEQKNAIAALEQELEKENTLQKSLHMELQSLKATVADDEKELQRLRSFIDNEKTDSKDLNTSLLVKQSEVENLKDEVERKLKEHADYKKEVLVALNQKREEIKVVKEKREQVDSERDKKRKEIMEGLRVCREASIKQADEKEAELNEQRKKNCSLKEKLNSILASKESLERDMNIQKKMLECKIQQLKTDLENENTQSAIWSKSQIRERESSVSKANFKSPVPSIISKQAKVKSKFDDQVTSDSDHSSVDFNDLVNVIHYGKRTSQLQLQDYVKQRRF